MLGIMLGLLWGAFHYIFYGYSGEMAYLTATDFMYYWTVTWTIVFGVFAFLFALLPILGGAAIGAMMGPNKLLSAIGALTGMMLGGGFSVLLATIFFVRSAVYITGFYLLNTALTGQGSEWTWNQTNLILGGALILVALITRGKGSSSSNSSKKDGD